MLSSEDVLQAVRDKLFTEINKAKSLIDSANACISSNEYTQCAERLQTLGVIFTKFELEIFEASE